jgi:hypothetical protein
MPPIPDRRWPQIIGGVIALAMLGFVAMFGVVYFANE